MTLSTGLSHLPDQVVGVGCDVVHLPTMRRQVNSDVGPRFLANTFTDFELTRCAGDARRLAQHWAGKEAVAKAIGSGADTVGLRQIELHEIDVRHSGELDLICDGITDAKDIGLGERAARGGDSDLLASRWAVRAPGHLTWPQQAHEWSWVLSISDGSDYILAVAMASRVAGAVAMPNRDDTQAVAIRSTNSVSQDHHPRSTR